MNHSTSCARAGIARISLAALLAAAMLLPPHVAGASTPERGPIDQQQPESPWEDGGHRCADGYVGGFMQGVVPGVSSWEVVSLVAFSVGPEPEPVRLEVRDGAPDGPVLASASAMAPGGSPIEETPWVDFTFSPPVGLVPGSIVYLSLEVDDRAAWGRARGDAYPDGDPYTACGLGAPGAPVNLTPWGVFDFAFVTFAPASTPGGPGTPVDRDGDGIPDDRDPDVVGDVIRELPDTSFAAGGHRTALLSRLAAIEEDIAAGADADAVTQLRNLRRRVDGCGSAADRDDWVTDCDAQHTVRAGIDELITNLGG